LLDVGPVTFPAYPDADVKVAQRSYQHFRDEQRRHREAAEYMASRAAFYRDFLGKHGK